MKEHAALESTVFILGLKLFFNQNLGIEAFTQRCRIEFPSVYLLEIPRGISSALYQAWRNLRFVQFMRITYEVRYSHKWADIYTYIQLTLATYTLSWRTLNCFTFQPNPTIFKKAERLRPLNLQAAVIFIYAFFSIFVLQKSCLNSKFSEEEYLGFVNDYKWNPQVFGTLKKHPLR